MTDPKPQPCPCCRFVRARLRAERPGMTAVFCARCRMVGPECRTPDEAVAAWNRVHLHDPGGVWLSDEEVLDLAEGVTEGCLDCGWRGTYKEITDLGKGNDYCPECHETGTMTTFYGTSEDGIELRAFELPTPVSELLVRLRKHLEGNR